MIRLNSFILLLILILGGFGAGNLQAQVDSVPEDGILLESTEPLPEIFPLDSGNFLLIEFCGIQKNGQQEIRFGKYSNDLRQSWSAFTWIPKRLDFFGGVVSGKTVYILFASKSPDRKANVLTGLSLFSGRLEKYEFELEDFSANCIEASGEKVFIGGSSGKEGKIMMADMKKRSLGEFPIAHTGKGRVEEIGILPDGRVQAILFNKISPVIAALVIRKFTTSGIPSGGFTLSSPSGENLMSGTCSSLADGTQFVVGNYGLPGDLWSQGFYFAMVRNDKKEILKFYPFGEFDELKKHSSMSGNRIEDSHAARQRKKKLRYDLLMHPVLALPGRFLLIGEVYSATGRKQGDEPGAHRRGGARFEMGLVACFDESGNMILNNVFDLNGARSRDLIRMIQAGTTRTGWHLSIPSEDGISRHQITAWGEVRNAGNIEEDGLLKTRFLKNGDAVKLIQSREDGTLKLKMEYSGL